MRMVGETKQYSAQGWRAGIHDETMNQWVSCCSTLSTWQPFQLDLSTSRVAALVICESQGGCRRDAQHGYVALRRVTVTIADGGLPGVGITGGSLVAGGWRRGMQAVSAGAWDAVGVAQTAALIDGTPKYRETQPCDYTRVTPCPNPNTNLPIDTRTLADGRHTLSIQAIDSAQNSATVSRAIAVDNTPPGSPQALAVAGGNGWRAKTSSGCPGAIRSSAISHRGRGRELVSADRKAGRPEQVRTAFVPDDHGRNTLHPGAWARAMAGSGLAPRRRRQRGAELRGGDDPPIR